MIVEFSVKNFRSIKELQTISFVATGLKSPPKYRYVDKNNIEEVGNDRLLKTIGIYGANASGKSNIIAALNYFLDVLKKESSSESNLKSLCDSFLFQEEAVNNESFFQIVFYLEKKKYRYGFTVKRNLKVRANPDKVYSSEIVVSEWLYGQKEKNLVELFKRTGKEVKKDSQSTFEKVPPLPYEHSLFLTHAAAYDSKGICLFIRKFLTNYTITGITHDTEMLRFYSVYVIDNLNAKKRFLEFLSKFNLDYSDINIKYESNEPKQSYVTRDKIFLKKSFYNSNNKKESVELNLKNNESDGTKKMFDLAGLLLLIFNLNESVTVIIDEIDSNFHPSLLIRLIELFNDKEINKSRSQLLFTSHDTNLMSPKIMRRDQFYFTEKSEDDSTRLYSLADLKGIKNDADFAKQYLAGFYGALPILHDYKE